MLSPTDVHYLVGLLTKISNPESVNIILGDFVYDKTAEKKRDVDITVTYKNTKGQITAFKGIEVKRHLRPLNVSHVEQLALKLKDMPDLSCRYIVSASGYTKGAIRKAKAHGIELFCLKPWNNTMEGFEHIKFPPEFHIKLRTLSWSQGPFVKYNLRENIPDETKKQISKTTRVSIVSDDKNNIQISLKELTEKVCSQIIATLIDKKETISLVPSVDQTVNIISPLDGYFVVLENSKYSLKEVLVQGKVAWKESKILHEFKILIKEGEIMPYVGCAIAELPQGNLLGFTVSQFDRALKLVNINISERNKKKIRDIKLK